MSQQIDLIPVIPTQPRINIDFKQDDAWQKINKDFQSVGIDLRELTPESPVFFNTPEGRFQFNDFIQRNMKYSVNTPPGTVEHDVDVLNITFEIDNLGSVELKHLKISYEILHGKEIIEIGRNLIAKLLLQEIGSNSKVIWDDNLCQFRVDEKTREILQ